MADRAHVTNVEVLETFRTQLMLFIERANRSIEEVSEEVRRTRTWLQTEQKLKIQHEIRRRQKEIEQIEAEYYSARLANATERKTGIQMQLRKKKEQIRELEEKMRAVQGWLRHFDSKVEVEARKVEKLQSVLDSDMTRAVQFLGESAKALHDYSGRND